jgi:hypothetical protein
LTFLLPGWWKRFPSFLVTVCRDGLLSHSREMKSGWYILPLSSLLEFVLLSLQYLLLQHSPAKHAPRMLQWIPLAASVAHHASDISMSYALVWIAVHTGREEAHDPAYTTNCTVNQMWQRWRRTSRRICTYHREWKNNYKTHTDYINISL